MNPLNKFLDCLSYNYCCRRSWRHWIKGSVQGAACHSEGLNVATNTHPQSLPVRLISVAQAGILLIELSSSESPEWIMGAQAAQEQPKVLGELAAQVLAFV